MASWTCISIPVPWFLLRVTLLIYTLSFKEIGKSSIHLLNLREAWLRYWWRHGNVKTMNKFANWKTFVDSLGICKKICRFALMCWVIKFFFLLLASVCGSDNRIPFPRLIFLRGCNLCIREHLKSFWKAILCQRRRGPHFPHLILYNVWFYAL